MGNARASQDANGVTWNATMHFFEPDTAAATVDDLRKGCNRLPYMMVDKIEGKYYRADLLQ